MQKKPLAWGYTTGTCAQAATKAAMRMLLAAEEVKQTEVTLPSGTNLMLEIEKTEISYGRDRQVPERVRCAVRKDSGDDPDITNGVLVYSQVERTEEAGIRIDGGAGIGRVTKPGLEQPVGSAAINRVPRQMIRKEVEEACEEVGYGGGIAVEISIPGGEELAKKTFNPRLGIAGGLSILGTSGKVEPMSEQALIDTIRLEIQVKLAGGHSYLIAAPGNYGLDFLKQTYGVGESEVIKCSNYIGQTIDLAAELGCKGLLLAGHIGKLIKVSGGIMNTHSRYADCRMELLSCAALRAGLGGLKAESFLECTTTDDALMNCTGKERAQIMEQVIGQAEKYLKYRGGDELQVETVMFSNVFGILGKSAQADAFFDKWKKERMKE